MNEPKDTNAFSLRLPRSMRVQLDSIVRREGTSINQFICIAIAEKIIRSEEIMEANETGESADARAKARDYPDT